MLKRSKTESSRRKGPFRILVVDDNADAATLIGRLLRRAEYEVAEVADFQLAMTILAEEPGLSAVIASFSTAGSGASLKLLDAVRNNKSVDVRDIPVVMITDQGRQLLFAWQGGVDEVLVRPFHEEQLLESVAAAVQRRAEERVAHREEAIHRLSAPADDSPGSRPVFS